MAETKYEIRRTEHGDTIPCDRCGTEDVPTVETRWDDVGKRSEDIHANRPAMESLCVFCYETHFGSIFKYEMYREERTMARAMVQAFHILLRSSTSHQGDRK